ncbi:unnamed protein product [Hermetia illucens]|uniref:Uncharacterized protein n=1 Tax=Hermetia illucens TaxID=343691 RepID=A0A7R8UA96_HERIL|nr:unnamed protein product [Hermetia illucens]
MDYLELYNEQLERARTFQKEMEAMARAVRRYEKNYLSPYLASNPEQWLQARKLFDQACVLRDLMKNNLQHIHRVEHRRLMLLRGGDPLWYHEDDAGYLSGGDYPSSDDANDANESLGYETESDHGY